MELIVSKILCIALSLAMLGTAYLASRTARSWLLPACIYSVAWFLFTFIPLVTVATAPANPLAIGYILLTCIAFSIPAMVTHWPITPRNAPVDEVASGVFDTLFLRQCFFFFAALALVALVVNARIQGLSLSSLTSNFFQTSNALIADRYNETAIASVFAQISNVACYIAVGLAGLVLPGCRSWLSRIVVLAAAMTPSVIVMVVFGAKGMIFLCIAMFYAGTLIRRLRRNDNRLIDRRTLGRAVIGGVILLPLITISFVARGLYETGAAGGMVDGLLRYYVSYSCAHLYAFSDWFSWYIGQSGTQIYAVDDVTGGFYTFMSLFTALGSTRVVPPGVYVEYFQYGNYIQTNIYTMFRGLIIDYTLAGSLVVTLIAGFVCNSVFLSIVTQRFSSWGVAFYIVMTGYIYTSFIISLLIWNSTYPVFVALGLVLMLNAAHYRSKLGKGTRSEMNSLESTHA